MTLLRDVYSQCITKHADIDLLRWTQPLSTHNVLLLKPAVPSTNTATHCCHCCHCYFYYYCHHCYQNSRERAVLERRRRMEEEVALRLDCLNRRLERARVSRESNRGSRTKETAEERRGRVQERRRQQDVDRSQRLIEQRSKKEERANTVYDEAGGAGKYSVG